MLGSTVPNLLCYDVAFAYELAIIVREGIRRMYEEQEDLFYYLTVENENYPMPALQDSKRVREGILSLLEENERSGRDVKIRISLRSDTPIWDSLSKPDFQAFKRHRFELEFNLRHFDSWSGRIEQEHLTGTMRLRRLPKKHEPCSVLYRVPKVLSNGDVTLCGCRDLNGDSELVLGNLRDRSLLEMWRDPRVEEIRSGFYLARYPRICRDCSMYEDLGYFRRERIRSFFRAGR